MSLLLDEVEADSNINDTTKSKSNKFESSSSSSSSSNSDSKKNNHKDSNSSQISDDLLITNGELKLNTYGPLDGYNNNNNNNNNNNYNSISNNRNNNNNNNKKNGGNGCCGCIKNKKLRLALIIGIPVLIVVIAVVVLLVLFVVGKKKQCYIVDSDGKKVLGCTKGVINKETFKEDKTLASLNIEDFSGSIAEDAFDDLDNLTEILVSESNKLYSSSAGVLYDKDKKKIVRMPINFGGEDSKSDSVVESPKEDPTHETPETPETPATEALAVTDTTKLLDTTETLLKHALYKLKNIKSVTVNDANLKTIENEVFDDSTVEVLKQKSEEKLSCTFNISGRSSSGQVYVFADDFATNSIEVSADVKCELKGFEPDKNTSTKLQLWNTEDGTDKYVENLKYVIKKEDMNKTANFFFAYPKKMGTTSTKVQLFDKVPVTIEVILQIISKEYCVVNVETEFRHAIDSEKDVLQLWLVTKDSEGKETETPVTTTSENVVINTDKTKITFKKPGDFTIRATIKGKKIDQTLKVKEEKDVTIIKAENAELFFNDEYQFTVVNPKVIDNETIVTVTYGSGDSAKKAIYKHTSATPNGDVHTCNIDGIDMRCSVQENKDILCTISVIPDTTENRTYEGLHITSTNVETSDEKTINLKFVKPIPTIIGEEYGEIRYLHTNKVYVFSVSGLRSDAEIVVKGVSDSIKDSTLTYKYDATNSKLAGTIKEADGKKIEGIIELDCIIDDEFKYDAICNINAGKDAKDSYEIEITAKNTFSSRTYESEKLEVELDVVSSLAGIVTTAPLVDHSGNKETPLSCYDYDAIVEEEVEDDSGNITISVLLVAHAVPMHSNGAREHSKGYWVGVGISQPTMNDYEIVGRYQGWEKPTDTFEGDKDSEFTEQEVHYESFYCDPTQKENKGARYVGYRYSYKEGENTKYLNVIYEITFDFTKESKIEINIEQYYVDLSKREIDFSIKVAGQVTDGDNEETNVTVALLNSNNIEVKISEVVIKDNNEVSGEVQLEGYEFKCKASEVSDEILIGCTLKIPENSSIGKVDYVVSATSKEGDVVATAKKTFSVTIYTLDATVDGMFLRYIPGETVKVSTPMQTPASVNVLVFDTASYHYEEEEAIIEYSNNSYSETPVSVGFGFNAVCSYAELKITCTFGVGSDPVSEIGEYVALVNYHGAGIPFMDSNMEEIHTAPLVDNSNKYMEDLYQNYEALGGKITWNDNTYTVPVTLHATELKKHENANHDSGYWVGLAVATPTKIDEYSVEYYAGWDEPNNDSTFCKTEEECKTVVDGTLTNNDVEYKTFYFGYERAEQHGNTGYVAYRYLKGDDKIIVVYKITFEVEMIAEVSVSSTEVVNQGQKSSMSKTTMTITGITKEIGSISINNTNEKGGVTYTYNNDNNIWNKGESGLPGMTFGDATYKDGTISFDITFEEQYVDSSVNLYVFNGDNRIDSVTLAVFVVSSVTTAPLADKSGKIEVLFEEGSYKVTPDASSESNNIFIIPITLSAKGLKAHVNSLGLGLYWVGLAVEVPNPISQYIVEYYSGFGCPTDDSEFQKDEKVDWKDNGLDYKTFYFNGMSPNRTGENANEGYVAYHYIKTENEQSSIKYTVLYRITFDVTIDEKEIPIPAPLVDQNKTNPLPKEALVDTYKLTETAVGYDSETKAYIIYLNLKATGVLKHSNGSNGPDDSDKAHWVGVGIQSPYGSEEGYTKTYEAGWGKIPEKYTQLEFTEQPDNTYVKDDITYDTFYFGAERIPKEVVDGTYTEGDLYKGYVGIKFTKDSNVVSYTMYQITFDVEITDTLTLKLGTSEESVLEGQNAISLIPDNENNITFKISINDVEAGNAVEFIYYVDGQVGTPVKIDSLASSETNTKSNFKISNTEISGDTDNKKTATFTISYDSVQNVNEIVVVVKYSTKSGNDLVLEAKTGFKITIDKNGEQSIN